MKIFFTDIFELPLPEGHRFPMAKYRLLREAVADGGELVVPDALDDEQLMRAHDPAYVAAVRDGTLDPAMLRRIGFPWSPELVERSRRSAGATLAAARACAKQSGPVPYGTGPELMPDQSMLRTAITARPASARRCPEEQPCP